MSYITKSDLENYSGQTFASSLTSYINTVIAAVQAYIENYTGVPWDNGSTSADKYYDGSGTDTLIVDLLRTVSAVVVLNQDGSNQTTLVEGTDFDLGPYNQTGKTQIILRHSGSNLSCWPEYKRAVKVTGVFGASTVPDPIKMAAMELAMKLITRGQSGGDVQSESLGSYSITYAKVEQEADLMGSANILDQYRSVRLD